MPEPKSNQLRHRERSLEDRVATLAAHYRTLDALSLRMAELVGDDPAIDPGEALAALLAERQHVVDALVACDQTLPPGRDAWEQAVRVLSPVIRQQVESLMEESRGLARAIAERDEDGHARLTARRTAVSKELAELFRARTATRGYGASGPPSPRFHDQEA